MTEIRTSGPMFDGRAEAALDRFCHHAEEALSEELVQRIRAHLTGVLREDTGRYQEAVHTEVEDAHMVVTDRWIVYGPWLEGVGSRNSPRTRFPGYHTFRIVAEDFQAESGHKAEDELPPYVREMNE